MSELVFRNKTIETEVVETPAVLHEPVNDDVTGAVKLEDGDEPQAERESPLEKWELQHGKYGEELLGIKEVVGEFPYKMQFSSLDNYIKDEMKERDWEPTAKHYQDILAELETETGTKDTESLSKMKKIFEYLKIVKKYKTLKEKKDSFRSMFSGGGL